MTLKRIAVAVALVIAIAAGWAQNTAVYPSAVATYTDLLVATNISFSTLSGSIDNAVTTIVVADGSGFPTAAQAIVIDSERIRCTSRSSNTFSGCTRGFDGSSAAAHTSGVSVYGRNLAWHHNQLAAEVRALETQLGVNFMAANGLLTRTSAGNSASRTITGTANRITVTNGDGVSGNPTIDVGSEITPTGMVGFFALGACPTGWSEYTALRGRYAVGLVASGTLEGTSGTALTNVESRAVGQHTHSVTDPGHTHTANVYAATGATTTLAKTILSDTGTVDATHPVNSATTGITNANSGSVTGTNAPYIQLLACKKD